MAKLNLKFKAPKLNIKVILALIMAASSLYFLYGEVLPKDKRDIKYEQYIKVTQQINVDDKIEETMITYDEMPSDKIPKSAIKNMEQVKDKFAATTIYPDEVMIREKIKSEVKSEYGEDEREVRIYTNVQAYGGVGSGDRADLIYTGELKETGKIGILKYEGVLVKKVLNEEGISLETVGSDKYNKGSIKPFLAVLTVNQDKALEIETLQRDGTISFKLIKWTERSKKLGNENKKLRELQIINESVKEKPLVQEVN